MMIQDGMVQPIFLNHLFVSYHSLWKNYIQWKVFILDELVRFTQRNKRITIYIEPLHT